MLVIFEIPNLSYFSAKPMNNTSKLQLDNWKFYVGLCVCFPISLKFVHHQMYVKSFFSSSSPERICSER